MERLLRIPLLGTMTAVVLALAWFLRPLDRSALFPVSFSDGKEGYVNAVGRVAIPGPWKSVRPFESAGVAIVNDNSLIDRTGRVLVTGDAMYRVDSSGFALIMRNKKCGFVDRTGRLAVPMEWDGADDFGPWGLAHVWRGDKHGFVDATGRLAVPLEWEFAKGFSVATDRAFVLRDNKWGKWGCIDRTGKVVIPFEWDGAADFDESGLALVVKAGQWGFIDVDGKVAVPVEWDRVHSFEGSDLAFVERDGLWGAVDRSGRLVLERQWDEVEYFDKSGLAMVRKGEKCGFIDRTGKIAIPLEWDRAFAFEGSDRARVRRGDKWGWIDRAGVVVIPVRWDRTDDFDESGVARVVADRKIGFVDRTGRIVVPVQHEDGSVETDHGAGVHRILILKKHPPDERSAWTRGLESLGERVGWKQAERSHLCELYDTEGRLVWSSDGFSEGTWLLLVGIAIGLLVVVEVGWLVSRSRGAA